jgi:hypothetical protein
MTVHSGAARLRRNGACWGLCCGLLLVQPATAFGTRLVDYLYIAANEGGSSGGHAAIRFERETYHFQHHPPGVLRLHRDDSVRFLNVYGNLENRAIRVSRIAVSDDTYALLRDRFNQRYLSDAAAFGALDAWHLEEDVLAHLLARPSAADAATLPLSGAGYFFPDGGTVAAVDAISDTANSSPALDALRAHVEAVLGSNVLAQRVDAVTRSIAALRPRPGDGAGGAGRVAPRPAAPTGQLQRPLG